MIGISSCLTGICCRYDGRSNLVEELKRLIDTGQAISFCPEVLGGMPTPRDPAEIVGGSADDVWSGKARVMTVKGEDVTAEFKAGALKALKEAQAQNIHQVILKANSPSCGSAMVYDGTFSGKKIAGAGITTSLFRQNGIRVMDENAFLASVTHP
ncbi:DUF523 domain-containing protein [Listeria weihenstephanensis]|uniref:DUF523 domain-containing protein n=1 Tax=Listeria weihenstephanensis TaxID=1006155 RepID=A0A841Z7A1_9LIST|nr:DUF523 domain-containing protein [Listeria weihenstephanensis]MBC1500223.1 DUF523 domain-containing protein [Listeria weihenstephanensis]